MKKKLCFLFVLWIVCIFFPVGDLHIDSEFGGDFELDMDIEFFEDDEDLQTIMLDEYDPIGYIYCDKTGVLISGGRVYLESGPPGGFIFYATDGITGDTLDGRTGYYQFFTNGVPGVYTLGYTHPDGFPLSVNIFPEAGAFDPTGKDGDPLYDVDGDATNNYVTLGSNVDDNYLVDITPGSNPYYLSFDLNPGDPLIDLNNIPVSCIFIGSIVCEDQGGDGNLDMGIDNGFAGITVNLFDCADTLRTIATTVTGNNGAYRFDGLYPGCYRVQFEIPDNFYIPVNNGFVGRNGWSPDIELDFGDCDTTTTNCLTACPTASVAPSVANICQGESVQLNTSINVLDARYSWTPSYGLDDPFIANPVANPFVSTTYIVEVDPGFGGCVVYDTVRVNVFDVPNPDFHANVACVGEPSVFDDESTTYTTLTSWYWDFGDGVGTSTQQNPSYTYAEAGHYLVKLIVESTNGCRDSAWQEIVVNPGVQALAKARQDTICAGECVELIAQGGTSFSWSPASTLNHTDCFNPIACPTTTTTYHVTVTNDFGCSDTESVTVTVVPGPTVDVTMTDVTECGQFDGTITINANGAAGSYQYSIDGGLTYSSNNTFTNLPASSYLVFVKGGGCEVPYPGNPVTIGGARSPVITEVPFVHPSCEEDNGSIAINASGASGLLYSINGGVTWVNNNSFTSLSGGIYYLAVASSDLSCITYYPPITLVKPVAPTFTDVSHTDPTDCGENDGTITVIAESDEAIEYGLDNGLMTVWQSGNNFINLPSGIYDVYIRNAGNTCVTPYALNSIELADPQAPDFTGVVVTQPTDCGTDNASITILATEGSGALEYSIDGGINWDNFALFENLKPGTYNVFIRNQDGTCAVAYTENPIDISYPDAPQIQEVLHSNPSDCGQLDGLIEITADGGVDDLVYSVDGGDTWQNSSVFNNLSGGIYNVRVANSDGSCIAIYPTLELTDPVGGTIDDVLANSDCGNGSGSITIEANSDVPLEYSINGGLTFQSSNNFFNLTDGDYNIVIRNVSNQCAVIFPDNPVTISSITESERITNVSAFDPTDCGVPDGGLTIEVNGGNLVYSIDGGINFQSSSDFADLPAGTYNVFVKDLDTECLTPYALNPIELVEPEAPVVTDVEVINPSDCNVNDAVITIVADGDGGLQYSLDGTTWSNGNTFINLLPGLYNIWVRNNDESCPVPYINNPVVITAPTGPIITECIATNPSDCDLSDGSITVLATGGDGPLMYSIDGGTNWQTSNVFEDLDAGVYSIAVANNDESCKAIHPICELTEPELPIVNDVLIVDPSECGESNGSITILAEGNGALEYSIDNGETWSTNSHFANLGEDTYDILIRNSENTCELTYEPIDLTAPLPPLVIEGMSNTSTCTGSSIPVSITLNMPISHFTIFGSGGYLNTDVSGSTLTFDAYLNGVVNNFTVILENEDGCSVTEEFALFQTSDPEADFIVHNPICAASDVTVEFTGEASPGATLNWDLDGGIIVSFSPATASAPAGATLVVQWATPGGKTISLDIDDGGCTDRKVQNINVNKLPFADAGEDVTICEGECVQLDGFGNGSQYQWSPAIGLSATDIPNPVACPPATTTYQLLVMGADGCMVMDEVTVSVSGTLTAHAGQDVSICEGESAQLNATGGVSYEWSPNNGLSNPNISSPIATPDRTTLYTVTVTNATGCIGVDEVLVTVHPKPIVDAGSDQSICLGENTMLAASGGVHYLWSPAKGLSTTVGPNPIASPTTTTTYTVVVTDVNGCTHSDQVTVFVGSNLVASAGPDQTICAGTITQLNASGGNSYSWTPSTGLSNPYIANPRVSPLVTTTYTVEVVNSSGCVSTDQVTIFVNNHAPANAGNDATICAGNSTQLSASGGLSYVWSPTTGLSNPNIANPIASPTQTTTYTVTTFGAGGCSGSDQVTVYVTTPFEVVGCEDKTICPGGSVPLNVTTGTFYLWTPATGLSDPTSPTPVASPTQTTTYTIFVTDANGCTGSDQVTVFVGGDALAYAGPDQTVCAGTSLQLNASGGVAYSWSPTTGLSNPNIANPTLTPVVTTTYTVTVTTQQGCVDTDQITVFVNNNLPISAGVNQTICAGETTQLNATGGVTYSWTPSIGLSNPNIANPIANPTQTTTYCLTTTNAQGCTGNACVTIYVTPGPTVTGCPDTYICQGGNVRLTVNGGVRWIWSPSTGLDDPFAPAPVASPAVTTIYTVTGIDANGCSSTDEVIVFVEGNATANAGPDQTICQGSTTQLTASGGSAYSWSPAIGLSNPNIANPVANPATTTTYTVTVSNGQGCIDTDQVTVFVENNTAVYAGNDVAICRGELAQLNASGGVSYSWSPGAGLSNANIANPVASPSTTTVYTVTATTFSGCVSTDQVVVTVQDAPTVIPNIIQPGCCNNDGLISLTVVGGSGNFHYSWTPNVSSTNTASGLSAGNYKVVITDYSGCDVVANITLTQDCQCVPISPVREVILEPGETVGSVCLPVNLAEIHNYQISVAGSVITPNHGCDFQNLTAYSYALLPGAGNSGPYKIDSWRVNGTTYTGMVNNITELTNWMNSIDPTGGWIHNPSTLSIMGGNPAIVYGDLNLTHQISWIETTLNPNTTGVAQSTLVEVPIGTAESMVLTIRDLRTCCEETVLFIRGQGTVNTCTEDIVSLLQTEIYTGDCNGTGPLCIDIPLEDIFRYSFQVNGQSYSGGFAGCNFDTMFAYTYFTIPNHGQSGPYRLRSWTIDGQSYSGQFNTIADLVNMLNNWDPAGNWKQDANTLTLQGGVPSKNYGMMDIEQILTGAFAILELNSNLVPMGTELSFAAGANQLLITNNSTGCTDQLFVSVICNGQRTDCEDFLSSESAVYETASCGNLYGFCVEIPMDELGNYSIDMNGSFYTGAIDSCTSGIQLYAGVGKHLFTFTNELTGCSDEIVIKINCVEVSGSKLPVTESAIKEEIGRVPSLDTEVLPKADADNSRTTWNTPAIINVVDNDLISKAVNTLNVIEAPKNGTVQVNEDLTVTYIPKEDYCDPQTPDFFRYEICNNKGCDETSVKVIVDCTPIKVFTGFSPNGDGLNDYLRIDGLHAYPDHELKIFNRSGNLLFETRNYDGQWDGRVNGEILPEGTYFYLIEDGKGKKHTGYLYLNR